MKYKIKIDNGDFVTNTKGEAIIVEADTLEGVTDLMQDEKYLNKVKMDPKFMFEGFEAVEV